MFDTIQHGSSPSLPLKRVFDIVIAGFGLILLIPLFIVVVLLIACDDGGSPFFIQPRIGKHGKLFRCYKFRSMRGDSGAMLTKYLKENAAAAAEWNQFHKLKNDPRVTRLGNILRRSSIDELLQLINVLLGDMSLVGPRPILQWEADAYGGDFIYYAAVRPGITGLWQVSGRHHLSGQERVKLDVWYVRNMSFWMDIHILLKTIPVLFSGN